MLTLVVLAVFVVGLTAFFLKKSPTETNEEKQPPTVQGKPIIGCSYDLFSRGSIFLKECESKYGPNFRFQMLGKYYYIVSTLDEVRAIIKISDNQLSLYNALLQLGFGLVVGENTFENPFHIPIFKSQFTPRLKNYHKPLVDETIKYLNQIVPEKGALEVANIRDFAYQLIVRGNARNFIGSEVMDCEELLQTFVNIQKDSEIITYLGNVLPLSIARFLTKFSKLQHHFSVMKKHLSPIIKELRTTNKTTDAFLQCLIDAKTEDGKPYDDEIVIRRMAVFIWSSISTSGGVFAMTLLDICSNEEIKQKVIEELSQIRKESPVAPGEKTFSYDDIQKMKYLEGCFNETLRLRIGPLNPPRMALEDVLLNDKYIIKKGSLCSINNYTLHRNPEVWPDPEKYDPSRYFNKSVPSWALLPFGYGIHTCPGRFFIKHQVLANLSVFFENYNVVGCEDKRDSMIVNEIRPDGVLKIARGSSLKL